MVVSVALWGSLLGVPAPPEEPYPATLDLQWNAPPGCSSAASIESRIAALLSGPPRGDGEAKVIADVEATSRGVHMTLTTTFAGATDVREVDSASCEALADATAVLLAVSLEPGLDAGAETQPEPGTPQPEPGPPRTAAPATLPGPPQLPAIPSSSSPATHPVTVDSARPPEAGAPRRVAAHGYIGGGAEWGAVQDWTGVVQAGLGVRGRARPWAAEIGGTYVVPRRHDGGLYQVGAVGLRGCWTPRRGPWALLACGGGEFGLLRVDTRGLVPTRSVTGPSHGVTASLGALWQRRRLAAFVRSEGVTLLSRSRTTTGGADPEERAAQRAVSVRLMLGVRFDFTPVG
jgi:hypothetical protein